jgi:hypothetical protein
MKPESEMSIVITFTILCLIFIVLFGCTTRKAPGEWDANLRYTLTHPVKAGSPTHGSLQ